jgi:hypothetical protein
MTALRFVFLRAARVLAFIERSSGITKAFHDGIGPMDLSLIINRQLIGTLLSQTPGRTSRRLTEQIDPFPADRMGSSNPSYRLAFSRM